MGRCSKRQALFILKYYQEQIDEVKNKISKNFSEMEISFSQIKSILENNSGKSIEALVSNYDDLSSDINLCKSELDDVRVLLSNYVNEMGTYIQPVNRNQMMRVDRNDVWWNLQTIDNSVDILSNAINFSKGNCFGSFSFDEEEISKEKYNYNLLEDIDTMASRTLTNINTKIDELRNIYNRRIVPFENRDDEFKKLAKDTYYKIAGFGDIIGDFFYSIGEGFCDVLSGIVDSLLDLVKGFISLGAGIISYLGSTVVVLVNAPFGTTPDWAKNYFDSTNNMIGNILST